MASDIALVQIGFAKAQSETVIRDVVREEGSSNVFIRQAKVELDQFFAGRRQRFEVPVAPKGTPFQQRVWQSLQALGFGETISYSEQAKRMGHPKAYRAVANANGANPIPIIIPCHRVVTKSGGLGGYSPGVDKKQWLLRHESRQ